MIIVTSSLTKSSFSKCLLSTLRQTDRQTELLKDKQTDRQILRDRQTELLKDRQTDRQSF